MLFDGRGGRRHATFAAGSRLVAVTVALASLVCASARAAEITDVDPLLGTTHNGQTVPGPQLPFGFANPSPDTTSPGTSGYNPFGRVRGFSQVHVSGTGGSSRYGNFRLSPLLDPPSGVLPPATAIEQAIGQEHASPGYYSVVLEPSGIRAELTASRRVALHRYTFPGGRRAALYLDVGAVIHTDAGSEVPTREWVKLDGGRAFEGGATFAKGWGLGGYTLYFSVALDRPASLAVMRDGRRVAARSARARGLGVLADLGTAPSSVVKVGLSFRSSARARSNLTRETPGFNFDGVRAAAASAWRAALSPIEVGGGTANERTAFATALYHSQLMPHDLSGENVWWRSRRPHYEDFFTLWDTFRTLHPLLGLIAPGREAAMVGSLLGVYQHTGWLPDGRVAGNNGLTQGGSNADVTIADAVVKHLRGFSYRLAYRAVRKDAAVNSRRYFAQGRQLDEYARRGYIATDERASASRTLEYAYDDYAVAEVAKAVGETRAAARYRARSRTWVKLWDRATRTVRPRTPSGAFMGGFDPARTYLGWKDPYYEGTAYQYTTYVPHDVQGLINRLGGDAGTVQWLDGFFAGRPGGYTAANEQDLLAPYLYIHAGRPDLTDARVRALLGGAYGVGRGGLPDNDDAGSLSSWYVWGAVGLYPNAGQPYYYIGAPLFTRARIALAAGRSFTVSAPAASAANRYVVAARLDGHPLCRAFLSADEVARGGTLELDMAAAPAGWGACARPPSLERPSSH